MARPAPICQGLHGHQGITITTITTQDDEWLGVRYQRTSERH